MVIVTTVSVATFQKYINVPEIELKQVKLLRSQEILDHSRVPVYTLNCGIMEKRLTRYRGYEALEKNDHKEYTKHGSVKQLNIFQKFSCNR